MSCVENPSLRRFTNTVEFLHDEAPLVTKFSKFITPDEAEYLKIKGRAHFKESQVVDDETGELVKSSERTSSTAILHDPSDEVLTCIEHKLAHAANEPHSHLERLQLTRYRENQKYNPHYDWFASPGEEQPQRKKTVFTYLTTLDKGCGGATVFPELTDTDRKTLRVYPVAGDAVMWSNVTFDGQGDEKTLHGGEPVTCRGAEKIGLNAWFLSSKEV